MDEDVGLGALARPPDTYAAYIRWTVDARGTAVLLGGGGTSECFNQFCPDVADAVHVCSGGGVSLELIG